MTGAGAPATSELWDRAPCGLLVVAANGAILRANLAFCRQLGYSPAELAGAKRFQDLLPMGARIYLQTHWTPLLDMQGAIAEVQFDMLRQDGTRIPMLLSATRRRGDGTFHDEIAAMAATDRKLYERELLESREAARAARDELAAAKAELRSAYDELSANHRRKDEFLATLAHELRNPLAPIANVAEALTLGGWSAARGDWAAAILSRQVAQMAHLVDDLLDAARINMGKIELRPARVELAELLLRAAEEALPRIEAASQSLRTAIADTPMPLDADATRLTQIVANLLNNASKYSPAGALVELRAWPSGGEAFIEVRDNGIGIAPEQLSRIFEMFSQVAPALDRMQGGLGIGLALVQKLVGLHGGTVEAQSDGVGKGSRFVVRLPIAESAAAAPGARDPAPSMETGSGAKLVIVDDNVDSAETLAMALELFGHRPRTARTAAEGLREIEAFGPSVAVLDIGLPDMSGHDLARRIRAERWGAGMALIALTGWGQESDKRAAAEAGFDAHFTKPVDFQQLNEEVARLMRLKTAGPAGSRAAPG